MCVCSCSAFHVSFLYCGRLIPGKDSRELFRKGGRDKEGKVGKYLYTNNFQSGSLKVHL